MVVKTELCAFSEIRIYPGHGARFVTKTGQMVILSGSKVDSLYHQKKKPAKLAWTQAWRRSHKKLNVEATAKRRARKIVKVATRSFVGMAASEIKEKRKAVKPAAASAGPVKQALVKEAKEKAKKDAVERKKVNKAAGGAKAPAPKSHGGKGR